MPYVNLHFQLLLALFRVLEPAAGTIFVDGVDITTLGLRDCKGTFFESIAGGR